MLGVTFTFRFQTLKNTKCGLWADAVLTLLLIKLLAMLKWSWNTCICSIRIAHINWGNSVTKFSFVFLVATHACICNLCVGLTLRHIKSYHMPISKFMDHQEIICQYLGVLYLWFPTYPRLYNHRINYLTIWMPVMKTKKTRDVV